MQRKLLLFDIDGVLVKTGGPARGHAYALSKVFNINVDEGEKWTSGKTEAEVSVEMAARYGISKNEIKKHVRELFAARTEHAKENMRKRRPMACAMNSIKALKRKGYILGTASGNNRDIVKLKLKMLKMEGLFDVLGSSTGFDSRSDIIRRAIRDASSKFGIRFRRRDVFYFGDTPDDIEGGKRLKVNVVSVATGKYSYNRLKRYKPDYVLRNLCDIDKVTGIIEGHKG